MVKKKKKLAKKLSFCRKCNKYRPECWLLFLFFCLSVLGRQSLLPVCSIRLIYHWLNKLWKKQDEMLLCNGFQASHVIRFLLVYLFVFLLSRTNNLFISLYPSLMNTYSSISHGHLLASSNAASLNQWLVSSHRSRKPPPPHFKCPCPWDFINIISSSGAADMEQRAAINNSSLVLAACWGIYTTRSLLCRFGAVHDPKTSLLLGVCV